MNTITNKSTTDGKNDKTYPPFDPSSLPTSQLESIKFKISQITDSIVSLQRVLDAGGQSVMPPWPEILTKYNLLLSQTHNLSTALSPPQTTAAAPKPINGTVSNLISSNLTASPFAKLVLHPSTTLPENQLDNDLIPLLRNQQTTEVLRMENDIVRRLSERLDSIHSKSQGTNSSETHEAIIKECDKIRSEHDARCERALRAVKMLRDKEEYDWKARVAVKTEEPEDFVPVTPTSPFNKLSPIPALNTADGMVDAADEDGDSGDDAELEQVLGPSLGHTPGDLEESPQS